MHAGQATDSSSIAPSYVSGGSTTPLLGMTIGDCFDATVSANPDRLALVVRSQGIRWTYRELAAVVDRFASGLASLGLVAGERVGLWSPNNAEWVVTQFATARLGLILVTINPAYRPQDWSTHCERLDARRWSPRPRSRRATTSACSVRSRRRSRRAFRDD